jgi:broad specificity phosphatase PhoE
MSEPVVVYLIRHGRTDLNAAGLLRGRLDPPLDSEGRTEAAALANLFHDVRLAAVVCSPLLRARQTAERIAAVTRAPLEFDDRLLDRDYGSWAGHTPSELECRFGSVDAAPGVEQRDAFACRVRAAIVGLADDYAPGPVAVVAHDAVNRCALAQLVPDLGDADRIMQRTGCWNRLERHGSDWTAAIVDGVPDDGRRP